LPAPQPEHVQWDGLLEELTRTQRCRVAGSLPTTPGWFDRTQLAQALINLLRNAHEAGGPVDEVEIEVHQSADEQSVEIRDRGPGMSETVLAQALLPFYSTKRSGTGLGLALAREITEAHGGRLRIGNREHGGLSVMLILPPVPASV
jgi:two-component system nitrogen regulation sensor histidine kinase NtrY